jgi:hypothetical protein
MFSFEGKIIAPDGRFSGRRACAMPTESRFKVEIYFDPQAPNLAEARAKTDEIFSSYKMPCLVSRDDCRVYGDRGDPRDFGLLYAAVAGASETSFILTAISDGYFDRGDRRDTLMTSFFRKG